MADSSLVPAARAAIVGAGNAPTPEFHRFLRAIARTAGLTGDIQSQVVEITKQITEIQETGQGTLLAGPGIDIQGLLALGFATISLADSGVSPGIYGDAANVPRLVVDEFGRIISATAVPIAATFVPYFIPAGTTFIVPANAQALWAIPIELEGDAGLEIDGALVEVN